VTSDQKTRILIGTLVAAIVVLSAYAVFGGRGVTGGTPSSNAQVASAEGSTAPESEPGAPVLRIDTDNPVAVQSGGHQAFVSSDADLSYKWAIVGGTFEWTNEGPSVVWQAGTGTEAVLTCTGTGADGRTSTATLRVALRPPSAITRFEAVPPVITAGKSARIFWTVSNAEKLVLEPGSQDLGKSLASSVEVKPGETTVYTLKATDSLGVATSQDVKIKVVPAPELLGLRGELVPGSPNACVVVAEFKGGKAELKQGGQVVASSETSPLRFPASNLGSGTSFLVTVTNEAGSYVSNTLTFSPGK